MGRARKVHLQADICQQCNTIYHFCSNEVNTGFCQICYPWYIAQKQAQEEAQRAAIQAAHCSDTKVSRHNTRAIKAGTQGTLTLQQWRYAIEYFQGKCAYCGGPYDELEHIIPVSKGGQTTHGNCVPACRSCNNSKRSRQLEQCSHLFERDRINAVQHFVALCNSQPVPEQTVINNACRVRRKSRAIPVTRALAGGAGTKINRHGVMIEDRKYKKRQNKAAKKAKLAKTKAQ